MASMARENEKLRREINLLTATVSSGSASTASEAMGGGSAPVFEKLTGGQHSALRYHIANTAWANVKFLPRVQVFVFNPKLTERAYDHLGLSTEDKRAKYKTSLESLYKYEVNQKRSNVKTAVRNKYRSK
jgi:hypothetical protein